MKKIKFIALFLALFGIFSLSACGNTTDTPNEDNNDKPKEQEANEYRTTVKYPDGTPVTGIKIQWCSDTNCFTPVTVDSEGMAAYKYTATENLLPNLYVHLLNLPKDYTYNPNGHTATPTNRNMEIELIELTSFSSGTGTQDSKYVLSNLGTYSVSFTTRDRLFFSYTPTAAETLTIESHCVSIVPTNPMNPMVGYYPANSNSDAQAITDSTSGYMDNFKITTSEFKAGEELVFIIALATPTSGTTTFPAEVVFTISK